jgi:predicted regulator of Ras-like GTPase activity (Roadblock/LC7/MglB family)
MRTVLNHLNAVPGVIGTLVCGPDGQLFANGFPPLFEESLLSDVARTVAESAAGLATITGAVHLLDLRHSDARIVARPMAGATLLFLCAPSTSLQPLEISASVAVPKIEKLVAARTAAGTAPMGETPARAGPRGKLHALVQRINAAIEQRELDPFATRGEIALQAGFGLGFIDARTPDDAEKLAKLEAAAKAVLGESL